MLAGQCCWRDGQVVDCEPSADAVAAGYAEAVQAMLDAKARERQYDSIQTAVSYRDDPNEQYATEARALFEWRSAVWQYATAQLAAVQAGERSQPNVSDFITEVQVACPFEWPDAA
ncbi:hypothetical protein [Consotaella aegiceratis]|uniref:hypothetical protein n=1 Tax=Consotaella aegiceratis TaxID=3097961 RepID=UPI002F3FACAD